MGIEDILSSLGIMLLAFIILFIILSPIILIIAELLITLFDWIFGIKRKQETTSTDPTTGGIVVGDSGGDGNGTAGDGGSSGDCGIGGDCGGIGM